MQDFSPIKLNVSAIYLSLGTIVQGATSFFKLCIEAFKNENVIVVMSVLNDNQIKQNSAVMKDAIKNCLGNRGAVRPIEK